MRNWIRSWWATAPRDRQLRLTKLAWPGAVSIYPIPYHLDGSFRPFALT